eukprot:6939393-Karenia_brevis.AAC.1
MSIHERNACGGRAAMWNVHTKTCLHAASTCDLTRPRLQFHLTYSTLKLSLPVRAASTGNAHPYRDLHMQTSCAASLEDFRGPGEISDLAIGYTDACDI